jgi:phosphoglucosamine mutase
VVRCDVVARSGRTLADLAAEARTQLPQQLRSVTVADGPAAAMDRVAPVIAAVQADLGETGRLLVRPSGTEPLVRVMAEAPEQAIADDAVATVVAALAGDG